MANENKTVSARVRSVTMSAAKWAASTLILMRGEIGVDITNKTIKIGDGTSLFKDLPAISGGGSGGGSGSGGEKPSYGADEISYNNAESELTAENLQEAIDELNSGKVDKEEGKGLVSDTEKATWNAKAGTGTATTAANGLMSSADKTKLNGIAEGAEANVQADWNEISSASDKFIQNKPTSMPASDVYAWAKTANKPTYTASEVGAATPDEVSQAVSDGVEEAETYTDEQIAATISASQTWLPAVATQDNLPTVTDTTKTYLCRVTGENNVYQCVAGQDEWLLYSENTDYVDEDELETELDKKVDKVSNATENNFVAFDADGNAKDSGAKASDFATATQGNTADSAYQKPSGGIPSTDLSSGVQMSLSNADTALQSVPLATAVAVGGIKANETTENDIIPVHITLDGEAYVSASDGKSAYAIAVQEGFVGTIDEWLESLRGQDAQPNEAFALLSENVDYTNGGSSATKTGASQTINFISQNETANNRIFYITVGYSGRHGASSLSSYDITYSFGRNKENFLIPLYETSKQYLTTFYTNKDGTITATLNVSLYSNSLSFVITYDKTLTDGPYYVIGQPPAGKLNFAIYELRGQGIAPNIQPSPNNNDDTYKLRVSVVGKPTFDTDNLKGIKGNDGAKGDKGDKGDRGNAGTNGKDSALEAIDVTADDFTDGVITIYPDTDDYTEKTLKHHILAANGSGTKYIVANKRVGDSNIPIAADVTDDGVVTITTEAFDGEILLSSGSAYKYADGGGAAKHKVLVEGEDYTVDNEIIGIPTVIFSEALEVPLYYVHIKGRLINNSDGSEQPYAANLTFKKVPFEMSEEYEDENGETQSMSYGVCDEKLLIPFSNGGNITSLSAVWGIYFVMNNVEMWGVMPPISVVGSDVSFELDEIEIISI